MSIIGDRLKLGSLVTWYSNWRSLPVLSWIKGAEHFKAGDYRAAAEYYAAGLRDHVDNAAANCARLDYGRCLLELGRLAEAELVLEEAFFSATPRRPAPIGDVVLLLVRIKHMLGKCADAAYILRRQLARTPGDIQLLAALGQMLRRVGREDRPGEAAELRGKLLAARQRLDLEDALNAEVNCAIASLDLTFLDPEAGRLVLSRVLAAENPPLEAHLLHAHDLSERGRTDLGLEALRRAIEVKPDDFEAPLLLAKSYLAEGPMQNPLYAQQLAASSAQSCCWANPEALLALADSYALLDDDGAASLFRRQVLRLSAGASVDTSAFYSSEQNVERIRLI